MADERSLFERLDSIEATGQANNKMLAELLGTLQQPTKPIPQQNQTKEQSDRDILIKFLRQAKKSFRWLGKKAEFAKSKNLAIFANILLIIVGVVTSVISTICFQMYSTFTLFENIWIVFSIVTLSFLLHNQLTNEVNDLAKHSPLKYQKDNVGMLFPVKTKLVFRVFKWLAIISIVCNIVCIWTEIGKNTKVLATIMEILFLGAIIFALIVTSNFYLVYSIPWVEGHNLTTNEKVVLVLPPGAKGLMTEEECRSKLPFLFE